MPKSPGFLMASNNYYGVAIGPRKRVFRGTGPAVSEAQFPFHVGGEGTH